MARLKVFRTPIGFHDAYVAAPSKTAALAAWGTTKDLFARGAAEIVTDPALAAEPLAQPGVVLKRSRGTAAEHMTVVSKDGGGKAAGGPGAKGRKARGVTTPRPDRGALDAAQAALDEAEARHRREARTLSDQIEALQRRQREVDAEAEREREKLAAAVDREEGQLRRALVKWRGS